MPARGTIWNQAKRWLRSAAATLAIAASLIALGYRCKTYSVDPNSISGWYEGRMMLLGESGYPTDLMARGGQLTMKLTADLTVDGWIALPLPGQPISFEHFSGTFATAQDTILISSPAPPPIGSTRWIFRYGNLELLGDSLHPTLHISLAKTRDLP